MLRTCLFCTDLTSFIVVRPEIVGPETQHSETITPRPLEMYHVLFCSLLALLPPLSLSSIHKPQLGLQRFVSVEDVGVKGPCSVCMHIFPFVLLLIFPQKKEEVVSESESGMLLVFLAIFCNSQSLINKLLKYTTIITLMFILKVPYYTLFQIFIYLF